LNATIVPIPESKINPPETFDDIVARYEADPVTFLESILCAPNRLGREPRYEFPVSNECIACRSWDKITKRKRRHITRENHARDGRLPMPHPFSPDSGFFLLHHLSEPQLRQLISRYRRRRNGAGDERASLLDLYRRAKFVHDLMH
jgi:hypothetical protein